MPHHDRIRQYIPIVHNLSDDTLESLLEPFGDLLTLDLVGWANLGLASSTLGNTVTWAGPIIKLSANVPFLDISLPLSTHMQQ